MHVPYRDSVLTRLLQDSLGGNSRSAIVVTLRDEVENIEESLGTCAVVRGRLRVRVRGRGDPGHVGRTHLEPRPSRPAPSQAHHAQARLPASQARPGKLPYYCYPTTAAHACAPRLGQAALVSQP